jgi:hypothetical protein
MVDIGWRGQLAWALSALVRDATGTEPIHLHFGGAGVVPGPADSADIRRFAFDDSRFPAPFHSPVACMEVLTTSGNARLVSFERGADGEVRLEFGRPLSQIEHNGARTLLWRTAEEVARCLPDAATLRSWQVCDAPLDDEVRSVLQRFWTRPTGSEARAVCRLWYESDDVGTVVVPYRLGELLGRREAVPRMWRQGSLRATGEPLRSLVRAYKLYR